LNEGFCLIFSFVGWLYTIWAGVLLLNGSLIVLVWWKGAQWREAAQEKEAARCY
jgi:hypothetical protein